MNSDNEQWKEQRFIYELLKQQPIFRSWKKEQFVCQTGKCAYCKKPMQYRYTETDHFVSLYRGGTSEAKNMILVHHSCNKYKGTKTYSNDLSWIKINKYDQAVNDKYQKLLEEHDINKPVARENSSATTLEDHDLSAKHVEKKPTKSKRTSEIKKNLIGLGIVCLLLLGFIYIPKIYQNISTSNINSTLTDENRITYAEQAIRAYSEWQEKYSIPGTTSKSQCGESYLGNKNLTDKLTCEHAITYTINSFSEILDPTNTSIEQTGELPHATNENIALYGVAKCAEQPKSLTGTVLLTHSPYVAELRDTGSYKDVAAVIRLSDGYYFCTDNS